MSNTTLAYAAGETHVTGYNNLPNFDGNVVFAFSCVYLCSEEQY